MVKDSELYSEMLGSAGSSDSTYDDAHIKKIFDTLDKDGNGTLCFGEVQEGLKLLEYPPNYAFSVFLALDKDNDREIDFSEFSAWVKAKEADMTDLFHSVDKDKSGFIDEKELATMLFYLDMPTKCAKTLMAKLDINKDGKLSLEEFHHGFALIAPADFSGMKDTWLEYDADSDLAGVSAISGNQTSKRADAKVHLPVWTSAVAGAFANIFSRTVVSPLERTRIQMIADAGRYPNMIACMTDIFKNEGLKGLWAGNVLNCARIGPQMGVAFFAKDYFKGVFAGEGNTPTPLQTLGASMCSGITCQTSIYPIDLVRTRMMTSPGVYTGIVDCIQQTVAKEGFVGLYQGLLPANMFAVPYYGTQFFVYDFLKSQYTTFGRPADDPRQPHPLLGIPLGAASSMIACAVAFPFQMAWKRMQVQGVGGRPILYKNPVECIMTVAKKEGVSNVSFQPLDKGKHKT